jgi:dephospho-CoA kinase
MRVYGLTGGIASGKSEAARRFAEHGIPVIDADAVGHELIASQGVAESAVSGAFGDRILTDGVIDRAKLGAVVFADADARKTLNTILHPLIRAEVARQCDTLAKEGQPIAIIEAALFVEEREPDPFLDGLIVVSCSPETRLKRLVAGRGLTVDEATRRLDAQSDPENKLALADWVVDNEGELEELHRQVDRLAEEMRRHAE